MEPEQGRTIKFGHPAQEGIDSFPAGAITVLIKIDTRRPAQSEEKKLSHLLVMAKNLNGCLCRHPLPEMRCIRIDISDIAPATGSDE